MKVFVLLRSGPSWRNLGVRLADGRDMRCVGAVTYVCVFRLVTVKHVPLQISTFANYVSSLLLFFAPRIRFPLGLVSWGEWRKTRFHVKVALRRVLWQKYCAIVVATSIICLCLKMWSVLSS